MISNHNLLNPIDIDIVNRIVEELHLFYKCKDTYNSFIYSAHFDNTGDISDIHTFIKNVKNGVIINHGECISDFHHRQLIEWIDSVGNNIKIVSSNGFDTKHNFHPLTNIALWESHTMCNENIYTGDYSNTIYIKPLNCWDPNTNNININNKRTNYILSVRRQTPVRDRIFKKLLNKQTDKIDKSRRVNSLWSGVVRYSRYLELVGQSNSDKTTEYIFNEKLNSYIDIVFETVYEDLLDDENSLSVNITEKICMAILTKTMPVVFGVRGINKALQQMGFYTFNSEFGIDMDDYPHSNDIKLDKLIDGILYIDSLPTQEIHELYKKNYDKILHNYNLLNNLFDLNKSIHEMTKIMNYFNEIEKFDNMTTFSDFFFNIGNSKKNNEDILKNLSDFNMFHLSKTEAIVSLTN